MPISSDLGSVCRPSPRVGSPCERETQPVATGDIQIIDLTMYRRGLSFNPRYRHICESRTFIPFFFSFGRIWDPLASASPQDVLIITTYMPMYRRWLMFNPIYIGIYVCQDR